MAVDTLRRDHLGCYGYERDTSPAIDALAAESVRYERAFAHAPWTTASIGALMTSRYPTQLGIEHDRSVLHPDQTTLAEVLDENGYRTGAVISHTFCSSKWNFDQGFAYFDESNVLGHQKLSSQGVTELGLEFLEANQSADFFLWLHYFDPHFAYNEHSEYGFSDSEQYDGPVEAGMPFSKLSKLRRSLEPRDLEQIKGYYDSEIRHTDEHISKILAKLDELGLTEDTLIIFTADHGEEFLDHGRLGHAKSLYTEVVGVPLLIRYPDGAAGVVDEAVGLVDIFPTVLDVVGIESAHHFEGRSLRSIDPTRPVFTENARGKPQRAIVKDGFKLVERKVGNTFELYDLVADPLERTNLYKVDVERAQALKAELAQWGEHIASTAMSSEETELTGAESSSLEAMGYGGGDEDEEE